MKIECGVLWILLIELVVQGSTMLEVQSLESSAVLIKPMSFLFGFVGVVLRFITVEVVLVFILLLSVLLLTGSGVNSAVINSNANFFIQNI